ncbi:MAG: hypothetical protein AAB341_05380 [Planctomycetota bacterium]
MQRIRAALFYATIALIAAHPSRSDADPVNCSACHESQHKQLSASVHGSIHCQECHGGADSYALTPEQAAPYGQPPGSRPAFKHGEPFTGKPNRTQVPQLCGNCHADVARMNPYGIRTDQLAAYWTSVHGKMLKEKGETRVAVCIDCHGSHDVMKPSEPTSKTNPFNVPATCGVCHADAGLMAQFNVPVQVVDEYRRSVHGDLLLQQGDSGAPTCATCHGNHAATPPGFASVGAVCGQCHQGTASYFATSIHADQAAFHGCVQCHGGGPTTHFHLIERITKPTGVMIERYAHLLKSESNPSAERIAEALHSDPKEIIQRAMPGCLNCHEDLKDDASLQKFFGLLDVIASAEREYVETASELDRVGRGVLLVENERFKFEDAKTYLIALAPLQHTLNPDLVTKKVAELNTVCDEVHTSLARLENGLNWRYKLLLPIWAFALVFSAALYAKYKALRKRYVAPLPRKSEK